MTTERGSSGFRLLKDDRLRLLTDLAGQVEPDGRGFGLYAGDTRLACRLELRVDGRRPRARASAGTGIGPGVTDAIDLLAGGVRLRLERDLGDGLAERLDLQVADGRPRMVAVRLVVGFDGTDIFEVRGYRPSARGELLPVRIVGSRLRFGYLGRDSRLRMLSLAVDPPASVPVTVRLGRRGREAVATVDWTVELDGLAPVRLGWRFEVDEVAVDARPEALAVMRERLSARTGARRPGRRAASGRSAVETQIAVDDAATQRVLDRSLADLALLGEEGPGPGERFTAAGLPWFAALFGRDSLLTAYEAIAFRPGLARDALTVLAGHQAIEGDGRGGEPGQILHELRTGEMARLGEVPFGPSFGSVDATPLWLILLAEHDDWTGDRALLEALWPAALRALAWIDARAGRDPHGFVRYDGRPGALANEGWKDSPDSIRDRSGAIVPPPIALVEVQGYVYDAWRRVARLARSLGEGGLAGRLDGRAEQIRAEFRAAFWVADRSFPAIALGRDDRLADAIASNAGQALWSGILDPAGAQQVAGRLAQADLDSGWGLRTLAASEPAFDPHGYHTGSVWPHDTALITGGLRRAGFDAIALGLADHLLQAAAASPDGRLPELIGGEPRQPGQGPAVVAGACLVQAWSSAAPLHLVRSLLGLEPEAATRRLVLERPVLPSAVGRLRLTGLAVGRERVDLVVSRTRSGIRVRTAGGPGRVDVVVRA